MLLNMVHSRMMRTNIENRDAEKGGHVECTHLHLVGSGTHQDSANGVVSIYCGDDVMAL